MLLLTTGLFITGGDFVSDQREQAIRSELRVVGQQMSNDISRIDRVAAASPGVSTLSTSEQIPGEVAGNPYRVELVTGGVTPYLELTTDQPDIAVRVNVTATSNLVASSVDGGRYDVVYRAGPNELVIDDV